MEPHPVPKNILTVEFKLFGALSVRQFLKIVAACLSALVLFILPIPKLVTIPIIFIVVVVGILSALVKDFEVRFWGFLRAVFVSPRYVWNKQDETPKVLTETKKIEEETKEQQLDKAEKTGPEALAELSIDQLLEARDLATVDENRELDPQDVAPSSTNFESLYSQSFGDVKIEPQQRASLASVLADDAPMASSQNVAVAAAQNVPVVSPVAPTTVAAETGAETSQAAQTTQQLAAAVTTPGTDSATVNELFNQAKQQAAAEVVPEATIPEHRYIYGVVVDKGEAPIAGATAHLLDANNQEVVPAATSGSDGRFALEVTTIPLGGYVMRIQHPRHSFFDFKVNYEDKKLPAYKFKAK